MFGETKIAGSTYNPFGVVVEQIESVKRLPGTIGKLPMMYLEKPFLGFFSHP